MLDRETVDKHVGGKIRERRRQAKVTTADLAAAMDIVLQQLQKYESGLVSLTAVQLLNASVALNTKVQYFFEGIQEEPD